MPNRPRYSGSLYQRGPVWQLQYFIDGKRFRESAKTTSKDEASKLLGQRLAAARAGEQRGKPTTVAALADLYLVAQRARWKERSYKWVKTICSKHIVPAFGHRNPASILPGDLDRFISQQKADGASDCRVNRVLVIFKAVLRYAVRNKVIRDIPEFPRPFNELPYVRTGHIDSAGFWLLCAQIADEEDWLLAMVTAAYTFGFRLGELQFMRANQIDLEHHTITLPAGSTKNKMPRRITMNPDGKLTKLLAGACKGKGPQAYVFSRDGGSTPIRDFRTRWARIVSAAKITTGSGPGGKLLFHDLRRSSITRMNSAGLSETDSMAIAGHLSSAVHRRYKQISEWDARQIAAKIDIE